jgi:hypothetical protein
MAIRKTWSWSFCGASSCLNGQKTFADSFRLLRLAMRLFAEWLMDRKQGDQLSWCALGGVTQ